MLHTAQFREESYSFVVKHWVKRSKQVENAGFFFTFWHKSVQFLSIFQRNCHTWSAKFKKTCVFVYFPGARSNRSNPTSYSFYWTALIGLLWSGDQFRDIICGQTLSASWKKYCLVWVSFVILCFYLIGLLWSGDLRETSKLKTLVVLNLPCNAAQSPLSKVQNEFCHFGTTVYNSCQFPREIIKSAKLKKHIFQGLVQIEAIPHPIASIWLECFWRP